MQTVRGVKVWKENHGDHLYIGGDSAELVCSPNEAKKVAKDILRLLEPDEETTDDGQ